MNRWRGLAGAFIVGLAVVCLGAFLPVAEMSIVNAQPAPPCLPTIPFDAPSDPALATPLDVTASVAVVTDDELHDRKPVEEVTLSWARPPSERGAGCIWIGRGIESVPDPGGGSFAIAGISAKEVSFKDRPYPNDTGGPVCYYLVPISDRGVGAHSEVCADVKLMRSLPRGPSDAFPEAPAAGNTPVGGASSGLWLVGWLAVVAAAIGSIALRRRLRT